MPGSVRLGHSESSESGYTHSLFSPGFQAPAAVTRRLLDDPEIVSYLGGE